MEGRLHWHLWPVVPQPESPPPLQIREGPLNPAHWPSLTRVAWISPSSRQERLERARAHGLGQQLLWGWPRSRWPRSGEGGSDNHRSRATKHVPDMVGSPDWVEEARSVGRDGKRSQNSILGTHQKKPAAVSLTEELVCHLVLAQLWIFVSFPKLKSDRRRF